MSLDLACVVVVAVAAALGAFSGALAHLFQLGAVALGWMGARSLAPRLAPLLQGWVPPFAAHPLAGVAAFVACTVAALLLARVLLLFAPRRNPPGAASRGLGALLAAAQAAVVLWVAFSALVVWGRPVHVGPLHLDPAGSDIARLVRAHSAFAARPGR